MTMTLPQRWIPVTGETAANLLAELSRELPAVHQLRGRAVQAIARREDQDDVLFRSLEEADLIFYVHLTWSVESDPDWPWTVVYQSWDDFLKRWPHEKLQDDLGEDVS